MAAKTDGPPISLRPMTLRPGGGTSRNPFERFAKGAGVNVVRAKVVDAAPLEQEKKKPRSEVKIYTLADLEALQETNVRCPPELENFQEIQINTIDVPRQAQVDNRDWRGRAEPGTHAQAPNGQKDWQEKQASTAGGDMTNSKSDQADKNVQAQARSQPSANGQDPSPDFNPALNKMQKAEEVGRVAWQVGATAEGNQRTIREVKGILNKLTPEKFDLLSTQLIQLVTNKEVLHSTISLLFETAVAQPTFVVVYADLADKLAKALPESLTGSDKGQSFRPILLNTCQEEFEGAAAAQEKLGSIPEAERADAERRVKMRTLGNIRLIAELFNKGIVFERIVVVCIETLLGDARTDPKEDNVEAVCELLTKAGKKLEATTKNKAKFEGFFTQLDKLSRHKQLPPRMRFMVKDVIDLRKSSWIPRRDVLQAKKIDEIHAEAHAELGMVPTAALPMFQALPALPKSVIGPSEDNFELFPAFRGADAGWEASGKLKGVASFGGQEHSSAFFLSVDPLAAEGSRHDVGAVDSSADGPPAESAAAPPKRKAIENLKPEDRESRAKSLFSEYVSSRDASEATACVQELNIPGFAPKLIRIGITRIFDLMQWREQQAVAELLVRLAKQQELSQADLWEGLRHSSDQLSDLKIDIPIAPKALGFLYAEAVIEGVFELKSFPELVSKIEEGEVRRDFAGPVFNTLKVKLGEEKLAAACKAAGLQAEELFKADPEVDVEDLPSVSTWLETEGLQGLLA